MKRKRCDLCLKLVKRLFPVYSTAEKSMAGKVCCNCEILEAGLGWFLCKLCNGNWPEEMQDKFLDAVHTKEIDVHDDTAFAKVKQDSSAVGMLLFVEDVLAWVNSRKWANPDRKSAQIESNIQSLTRMHNARMAEM